MIDREVVQHRRRTRERGISRRQNSDETVATDNLSHLDRATLEEVRHVAQATAGQTLDASAQVVRDLGEQVRESQREQEALKAEVSSLKQTIAKQARADETAEPATQATVPATNTVRTESTTPQSTSIESDIKPKTIVEQLDAFFDRVIDVTTKPFEWAGKTVRAATIAIVGPPVYVFKTTVQYTIQGVKKFWKGVIDPLIKPKEPKTA